MKARNLIGFAGLVVTATIVTAFAMNAIVGTPTASANEPGKHREHKAGYDADIDQACKVNIEFSEVRRSGVCKPDASISQYGRSRGGYDADIDQKCKVNIEFSEVKDSNVCKPDADVKQGAPAKKHHEKPRHHDDGKKHDGKKDYEKPRHDGGKKHHAKTTVTYTNQEKTTCVAKGAIALNQCDVDGDANVLSITGGIEERERPDGGSTNSYGGDGGWDGGDSKYRVTSHSKSRYGWGDFQYTNQEKTTCEAYGLVALNQCDVEGDANVLSITGGIINDKPGQGPPVKLPLVGGLLG